MPGASNARSELTRLARAALAELPQETGATLLRGFELGSEQGFQDVVGAVTPALLQYDYASTPRSRRLGRIYTSTEYPAHQTIPLHNEMSYCARWPATLWFACLQPAKSGGDTPIADARRVFQRLDGSLRGQFDRRNGVRYVRNYGTGLDLSWQQAFDTRDRHVVEAYCRGQGIAFEWKRDDVLKTVQVCPSTTAHPRTGELVWFNQAHLFHPSALDRETRAVLLEVVEANDLPRNAYYGDGSPIEDSVLDEIRGAYAAEAMSFRWAAGDVLLIDNVLCAHGRTPFAGTRSVLVAMA